RADANAAEAEREATAARRAEQQARVAEKNADREARAARQAEHKAQKARNDADREAQRARQREDNANMLLAQNAWEQQQPGLLLDLLQAQKPRPGEVDLRCFEWHYWKNKVEGGRATLKGHSMPVSSVAFSPDGKRLASASGLADPVTLRLTDG